MTDNTNYQTPFSRRYSPDAMRNIRAEHTKRLLWRRQGVHPAVAAHVNDAQDLLEDYRKISNEKREIRGKGFKGAVGTGASYAELIGADKLADFEQKPSARLELPFYPVAPQTYPRKQDYSVLAALAGLAQSLYKLALDLPILQP